MSNITIGIVPRDRYCLADKTLPVIFEKSRVPFDVVIVDSDMPDIFRDRLKPIIEGRDNVRVIETGKTMTSNAARNVLLRENTSEFLCIIENDVFVHDDWLAPLVEACTDHPADTAAPLLLEPKLTSDKVHFDDRLGHIRRIQTPDGDKLEILPRLSSKEEDRNASRRLTDFVEMHCVMFRSSVFDRIGPFDEAQRGSRAEVDLSLALFDADVPTVLEPRSRVTFSPPPPVHPAEKPYYRFYWNYEGAVRDHESLVKKWNLVECPSALPFVEARLRLADEPDPDVQVENHLARLSRLELVAQDIHTVIPDREKFILVDDAQWEYRDFCENRHVFPFLERNGQYWGSPEDDTSAIREFERLHDDGASFIVFGWPAFWWLSHYTGFRDYLESRYARAMSNERIIIFDARH